MKRLRRLSVVGFTLLTSCGPAHVEVLQERSFVGKTWLSTESSAPLGTIRIFLPDGTLLMDSCGETYRLARWTSMNDTRIAWEEDTARIEADVTQAAADVLELRLHLRSEVKVERYRVAKIPYVCPDSR
jgi:hypothetical protein